MKIRFLLTILICSFGNLSAQTTEQLWNDANTAYINGQYAEAVRGYETILGQGMESAKLYLNLGNAYYKQGLIGKAILEYNRALRLSPADEDVRYNLAIAHAYVQDKIEEVPVFFVKRWLIDLGKSLSGNTWAVLSLVFFALTLVGVGTYLLLRRMVWQKVGFYGAVIFALFFVMSVVYASVERKTQLEPEDAIVMATAAPVKSSPDGGSKDIFVLHEGTKVHVEGALGDWREIRIADGNKGWIEAASIEMID